MGNGNKKSALNSHSIGNIHRNSPMSINNNDVASWSSTQVQRWIKEQCKIYELKKATAEKFELNGQALVLLSKHDFLRRSPDGGEVLYYALQRLINPNKANLYSSNKRLSKTESSDQHPRIVELNANNNEYNSATDSSSYPIIEEPDDPPKIQRSQSDTQNNNYQEQPHPQAFFHTQAHIRPNFFYQHRQRFPNTYTHAHQLHHPNLHMHQQRFPRPPTFIQQYHPLMFAQAIIVEEIDETLLKNLNPDVISGLMNGMHFNAQEPLYLVTYNGQRSVMNEGQITQLVHQISMQQTHQGNLQQQQQYFQQRFQQQQRPQFQQ